jgi:Cys-tRNA(Pro) deacylase
MSREIWCGAQNSCCLDFYCQKHTNLPCQSRVTGFLLHNLGDSDGFIYCFLAHMSKHVSETPATQFLRRHAIVFSEHPYAYEERGGTEVSARELSVDEHAVVKTLIMQDETAKPLVVLMHGDRKVSTKNLARQIGCKSVEPCKPEVASRHSGYQVGGTSPFGMRKPMPVYVEQSILDLDKIYINGGRRGYLVGISPDVLHKVLSPISVNCALQD